MIKFAFSSKNPQYVYFSSDNAVEYDTLKPKLFEQFNLTDPKCFLPSYVGIPYTIDYIWEYSDHASGRRFMYAPIGLAIPIWKWLKDNGYAYEGLDQTKFKTGIKHSLEEFREIVDSWGLSLPPRPYQLEAAYNILSWKQSLSSLATRAGKTLTAYMVFRYMMEYCGAKKILMIVPSIELVKQGYDDFNEYAEFFKAECLWSGGKVVESSNMTIATFQTLINYLDPKSKKYNPRFFDGYDVVFVDEVHRALAKSISTIITQPFIKAAKLIFGMTGTLPKEHTVERYALHAMLGPKIQQIKARDLMDAGYISKVKIYQHRLAYTNNDYVLDKWIECAEYALSPFVLVPNAKNPKKKEKVPLKDPKFLLAYETEFPAGIQLAKDSIFRNTLATPEQNKMDYKEFLEKAVASSTKANMLHTEVMMIHFMENRIDYLIKILKGCPNNTLVLAQHVEYIKHVAERVKEAFPDRHVIAVYGASKERKAAKTILKEHNDCIMIAGYSIMGTGITLSNLCYGVLFESFKSETINMQSIGRGLGLSKMKTEYVLHDIADVFDTDYASNKTYLQALKRIKMYKEEHYPFEIVKAVI